MQPTSYGTPRRSASPRPARHLAAVPPPSGYNVVPLAHPTSGVLVSVALPRSWSTRAANFEAGFSAVPPPAREPLVLHAEITADRASVLLIAVGREEDVRHAAKRVETLTPLFKRTDPPGGLLMPLTWTGVLQLQATFPSCWRPGPVLCAWITEQMAWRCSPLPERIAYEPPAGYVPRTYQHQGAALIARAGRALLLDEPGTGKTITAILGLVERLGAERKLADRPILVICPPSVIDAWCEAWETWAPSYGRALAWRGTPKQRMAKRGKACVYVVGYATLIRDAQSTRPHESPLIALDPAAVVVDEFHWVKNPHASRTQATRRLAGRADLFVGLSGTPITHHPGNLWSTLDVLTPHAAPSRERWSRRYLLTSPGDYSDEVLGLDPDREPEFRTSLLGQQRRVAKADVLQQLPPKIYSVRHVELPPAWRKVYDQMESEALAELPDSDEPLSAISVLAVLTRLAQLSSAAADVRVEHDEDKDGFPTTHTYVTLKAPSWKVDELLEILAERPGQHTLCFAPSRQLMVLAGKAAADAGYRVGYIIGGQTAAERTQNVDDFQAGRLDLLCATTQAGGVGLTLTAASTVVFLQRPWSLVDSLQAEDRAHRIGSERHEAVEIIDVLAVGTLDTRIRSVLRERAGQLSDLVQDPRIAAEVLGGLDSRQRKAPAARPTEPEAATADEPVAHFARIVAQVRAGQT